MPPKGPHTLPKLITFLSPSQPQMKSEPSLGDALGTKGLEERLEGDVSSPASTGTQVMGRVRLPPTPQPGPESGPRESAGAAAPRLIAHVTRGHPGLPPGPCPKLPLPRWAQIPQPGHVARQPQGALLVWAGGGCLPATPLPRAQPRGTRGFGWRVRGLRGADPAVPSLP